MTSHPSFEEIAAVVYPKAVNGEYFSLAAQVNAHLCACRDCKKIYHTLLAARRQAEDLYFDETDRDA